MTAVNINQEKSVTKKDSENRPVLRPLVTIVEGDWGFTLTAEMPGVPKEDVIVNVESDTLTLEGEIALPFPEGMEATHAEVNLARYKRAFTLSRELDTSKIEATQKDGVVTLKIPKAAHAQPRKIEVQIG